MFVVLAVMGIAGVRQATTSRCHFHVSKQQVYISRIDVWRPRRTASLRGPPAGAADPGRLKRGGL